MDENQKHHSEHQVNYEELKKSVDTSDTTADEKEPTLSAAVSRELQLRASLALEAQRIHLKGLIDFYRLRVGWSSCLKLLLIGLAIFQCFLISAVGFHLMDFVNYQAFLKIQATGYFAQIIGLCYVIVKYLFRSPDQQGENTTAKRKTTPTNNDLALVSHSFQSDAVEKD